MRVYCDKVDKKNCMNQKEAKKTGRIKKKRKIKVIRN